MWASKASRSCAVALPARARSKSRSASASVQLERGRGADAVVGGDCAVVHEVTTAVLQGGDVAGVAGGAVARCLDEPVHVGAPRRVRDVQVGVRAERGQDAAVEGRVLGDRLVAGEVVQGIIGGGQHLDVEVLEELAGTEAGLQQLGGNGVVAGIGGISPRSAPSPKTLSNCVRSQ